MNHGDFRNENNVRRPPVRPRLGVIIFLATADRSPAVKQAIDLHSSQIIN